MAALRIAATRLAGGQTPAVAVGEAQRGLLPRLFQVDRARSTTSSAAAANSNAAAGKGLNSDGQENILKEIRNRAEELYELTAEAQRMYNIPGRAGREVTRLRQELAAQVEPRSKDTVWRVLRGKSMFERYGGFAAIMFTTFTLADMATASIVVWDKEEKRYIKKKRGKA